LDLDTGETYLDLYYNTDFKKMTGKWRILCPFPHIHVNTLARSNPAWSIGDMPMHLKIRVLSKENLLYGIEHVGLCTSVADPRCLHGFLNFSIPDPEVKKAPDPDPQY
jgi:hypothetical protein